MLKLQFLICAPKTFGPIRKLHQNLGGTTALNARLNCQAYVCRDYAEFAKMNKDIVAKLSRSLWTAVQVLDTETGVASDPAAYLACVSEAFLAEYDKAISAGSLVGGRTGNTAGGEGGSSPSPTDPPAASKLPPPLPGEEDLIPPMKRVRNRTKPKK